MIRNVKALGLAVVAVAAMSMMLAASAQATQLHAATSPNALLTGEQTTQHKFQITSLSGGASVSCTQALFEGTISGGSGGTTTAQEVTATGTYTGCQFIGLNAQVTMNGCKYTLTNASPTASKTVNIDVTGCTAGKSIEVHVIGCTLTVPQQPVLSHMTLAQNPTNPQHVDGTVTATGITYELHGAACPHQQPETTLTHDGAYQGVVTFKASVDNGTQLATHNGHQYSKGIAGAQVGLTVT